MCVAGDLVSVVIPRPSSSGEQIEGLGKVIDWMSKQLRLRAIGPTIPRKYLNNQKTTEDDTDNGLQIFKPNIDAWMNWLNEQQGHSVIYLCVIWETCRTRCWTNARTSLWHKTEWKSFSLGC
ncbi:hypothetical protein POM88_006202 [Heracleum sosnowskyi]|uniref:Uncharacterized protein n=1 Tax=Heracleum sosnowskyi TaxID=360622 RepID=A0AAD8J2A4_9APIA|nr:hypothetical protein POM88_006202 [Heracleum sosnowskyi]